MHGIIGQLAADPVRLAIAIAALIGFVAIIRCLSWLAFFDNGAGPAEQYADSPRIPPAKPIEK